MIFYDSQGRQFNIVIDVPTMKRIRDKTGVQLSSITDESSGTGEQIRKDAVLAAEILTAAITPQLEQMRIPPDEYLAQLRFDDIDKGITAIIESYVDFLPEKHQDLFKKAISKSKEKIQSKREELDKKIEDGTVDRMLDDAIEEMFE